jgi:hypothetical protein
MSEKIVSKVTKHLNEIECNDTTYVYNTSCHLHVWKGRNHGALIIKRSFKHIQIIKSLKCGSSAGDRDVFTYKYCTQRRSCGFLSGVAGDYVLMEYDVVSLCNWVLMFRGNIVFPSSGEICYVASKGCRGTISQRHSAISYKNIIFYYAEIKDRYISSSSSSRSLSYETSTTSSNTISPDSAI